MADITKEFTVNVQDELWLNKWTDDPVNTATYTYTGTDTVWVAVHGDNITAFDTEKELPQDEHPNSTIIEIDCNDRPEIGQWMKPLADNFEYTYEDETQADGSVYKKITNPRLRDWKDLVVNSDGTDVELVPLYKNEKTTHELILDKRLRWLEKYENTYDLDDDTKVLIAAFKTAASDYITANASVLPWKYITVAEGNLPKLPMAVVNLLKTLPDPETVL
ncbi:MAG: hypothetical protein CMC73_04610 [Flavobacteriaceae bacterium]|nr:hypothetical protein [Flavobacteriaceae bacterium]